MAKEAEKGGQKLEITYIPLKSIIADPDQPRKFFDASRLTELKKSIEDHGLRSPLEVEKMADGKYMIIEGERRWRVLTELGYETVPVTISEPLTMQERRIRQFHLQGMHEKWTAPEQANAMRILADDMGVTPMQMGLMLGLNTTTVKHYIAFGGLLEKKEFMKTEIPMKYSESISAAKAAARHAMQKEEKKLEVEEERDLEKIIIEKIKSKEITQTGDVQKIVDSFRKDPKSVSNFLKGKQTIENMFEHTMARGYTHARRLSTESGYIATNGQNILGKSDVLEVLRDNPRFKNRVLKAVEVLQKIAKEIA